MPVADAARSEAGSTLGVEEEFHLVDPDTLALQNRPDLAAEIAAGEGSLHAEMLTSQLEAVTAVCTDLDELRRELVAGRRAATEAAAAHGAAILATSTHPFAPLSDVEVMQRPRYAGLVDRFGTIVHQLNLTGCHVHVGVPDLETAVAVMTHARPYLPVLAAPTGSSPFHEGIDTGYASFRLAWLGLWPQGGPPPALGSVEHYVDTVAQLEAVGLISDGSALLWELRPSSRHPTLEFRIADMCPDVDDTLLLAALVRSLVRTLSARVTAGEPAHPIPDAVLRAARWRAARYGIDEALWSTARSTLVPSGVVLRELLEELRPDLEAHGEYDLVAELMARLRARGTSATRQRQVFRDTGDLLAVAAEAVSTTTSCL